MLQTLFQHEHHAKGDEQQTRRTADEVLRFSEDLHMLWVHPTRPRRPHTLWVEVPEKDHVTDE